MPTTSRELKESGVSQITARLPGTVVEALEAAAKALHRSRPTSSARRSNATWRTSTISL